MEETRSEPFRVLITEPLDPGGVEILRRHAQVDIRKGLSEEELAATIGAYDALIVRSATRVTRRVIEAGKRLQVIGRAGVGIDNIDVAAATQHGVMVVNAPTANTIAAAEHTIALLLALARQIPQADASLRAGRWERQRFVGVEVQGKVLGIIGLGRIGSQVARRAQGLGMTVVAFDPFVSHDHAARLGVELKPLDDLLREADFISLHTPLTDATRGIIDARALSLVKPTARLINTARGALIDQDALYRALEEGRIAGAALDVFPEEPPRNNPLIGHPKVVVTPHLGGSTVEAQAGVARDIAEQVVAVLQGRLAEHAVNAPLVSPETLDALVPYIDLVERLGRFYVQIADGRVSHVRLIYRGELARHDTTPLRAAAIKGLLEHATEERINLVNAELIARWRGLEIVEEKSTEVAHFTGLVTLQVTSEQGVRSLSGTIIRGQPHIVQIDEYAVDFVPEGYMLVTHNRDQPGVIGQVGTLMGQNNVNIAYMQVGRDHPRGQAIMILGLDDPIPDALYEALKALPALYNVRRVHM